jgi:hypothetical protein
MTPAPGLPPPAPSPDSAGPGPDPDLDPLPGFGPAPAPRPGRRSPDPPSPDHPSPGDGGDGAPAESAPRRPLTPESFGKQAGAFTSIARALLIAVGGYLNMLAAVDADDTAFLTDDDDEAVIPPPLGRIAARRIKLGQLAENYTDLQDIGEAAVGILAWLAKGLTVSLAARRERSRAKKAATVARDLQQADQ